MSTAKVSNVIHGKTKKISDETVKRVQQLLEERQYIPSMAGILLAQNDSKIIMEGSGNLVNIEVNHFDGEVQAGRYLKNRGHRSVLCISDNNICMDMERFMGLKSEISNAELMIIPMEQETRTIFYMKHLEEIKEYSAVFAVSDYYAMDFIQFLKRVGMSVPEDISVVGFDNVRECEKFVPALTTIKQDNEQRAALAVKMLNQLRNAECRDKNVMLPVTLIERDSVRDVKMHKE